MIATSHQTDLMLKTHGEIIAQHIETIKRLTDALHHAINSPMGVVPDCAEEFYDASKIPARVSGTLELGVGGL